MRDFLVEIKPEDVVEEFGRLHSELDALIKTTASDGDIICTMRGEIQSLNATVELLREENEKLRQILRTHGRHDWHCQTYSGFDRECNCALRSVF